MKNDIEISAQERVLFIYDRALALGFEARRWPQTASMARAWLSGAAVYAMNHDHANLANCIIAELENLEAFAAADISSSGKPAASVNVSQPRPCAA